jgi:hypothetical protein
VVGFGVEVAAAVITATAIESVTSAAVFGSSMAGDTCAGRWSVVSFAKTSAAERVRMYPAAYTAITAAEPKVRRLLRFVVGFVGLICPLLAVDRCPVDQARTVRVDPPPLASSRDLIPRPLERRVGATVRTSR